MDAISEPMPADDRIARRLAASRRDLLDIGLRNGMISFRGGPKSVAVVGASVAQVFACLCERGGVMSFAPASASAPSPMPAARSSPADAASTVAEAAGAERSRPDRGVLQTALREAPLFQTLLKIQADAQACIDEQGVNILFLALGFLHWFEADASEQVRRAPLLLVPVVLERVGARDLFRLRHSGEDIGGNLSLAARLKSDFAIDWPPFPESVDGEGDDWPSLDAFHRQVAEAVSHQPRWRVAADEVQLGFFSFGKFLMFRDLDPAAWPDAQQPDAHPVLARLLGDGFADESPAVPDAAHLDALIAPGEIRFIRDADSSQTLAILEARAGRNLVIQGPPGTGKSQTISNIIAELIGSGRTVLFVAEKMAALDVVKRRLDEGHLGDAVLELHSHKATRRSVLAEIDRTLQQGEPLRDPTDDARSLTTVRDALNAYCEAVNTPLAPSGLSFVTALGRLARIRRLHPALPIWRFEPMREWTARDLASAREVLAELAAHLDRYGRPVDNPFWGSQRDGFSPAEQVALDARLRACLTLVDTVDSAAASLAQRLGLGGPVTIDDLMRVCRAALRAAQAPRLNGVLLSTDDWQHRRESVRALLAAGSAMAQCRARYDPVLSAQAWTQDLLPLRQQLAASGDRWWRWLSGDWRAARKRLRALCRADPPTTSAGALALIDAVHDYQAHRAVHMSHAVLGQALFGAQWHAEASDWPALTRIAEWVFALHDALGRGELPPAIVDFLSRIPDVAGLGEAVVPVQAAVDALLEQLAGLREALALNGGASCARTSEPDLRDLPIAVLRSRLTLWRDSLPSLYEQVRYNQLEAQLRAIGLCDALRDAADWCSGGEALLQALDASWLSGIVAQAYAMSPALAGFDPVRQAHLVDRFRQLDQALISQTRASLAHAIWAAQPALAQPGEMAVLRNELNRKRRHLPIRQLMDQAGRAIQAIKPVFMMSPMSIANFLPPGRMRFDVVIFDEASQVKAVDAFGALLRARQAIVVGDTRQMPPGEFFSREIDDDDDGDGDGDGDGSPVADIESVLSLFRARGAQQRYLSWHYRSRHQSLIAVSNAAFYESRLVVFPSAGTRANATGLSFTHLPDAIYDRGGSRTNPLEAEAVAQAVMAHAIHSPGVSLGVVAFSVAQRDLIKAAIERLLPMSEALATCVLGPRPGEPFFVKNLENVQGDERDAIFISIGYGRAADGRIARDFGPVNRDGGERRLNVLITRARLSMRVFCNFRAQDLAIDAGAPHGVRALRQFLLYAETRQLDAAPVAAAVAESPFEAEVAQALSARGYQVDPQFGTAGYFIDVAVRDPDVPGRWLLAIECDGASYHSARSARDRDRLRQSVLEGLGWRFHRIWSADWFRNPEQETDRAVAAIEAARHALVADASSESSALSGAPVATGVSALQRGPERAPPGPSTVAPPYRKAVLPATTGGLLQAGTSALIAQVCQVLDTEAPVHEADLSRRLMDAYGAARAGSRVAEAVRACLDAGARAGRFHWRPPFVYRADDAPIGLRDRSGLSGAERRFDRIPPEELDAALLEMVRQGFSIGRTALQAAAMQTLGFGRSTGAITAILDARIEHLLAEGRLRQDGQRLSIV